VAISQFGVLRIPRLGTLVTSAMFRNLQAMRTTPTECQAEFLQGARRCHRGHQPSLAQQVREHQASQGPGLDQQRIRRLQAHAAGIPRHPAQRLGMPRLRHPADEQEGIRRRLCRNVCIASVNDMRHFAPNGRPSGRRGWSDVY
jgi:hypothetical protein